MFGLLSLFRKEGGSPFPPVTESAEKAPNQSISEMMVSKDWKTRKWAYASLKTLVDQEKNEASAFLMEYSTLLPKILKDNNISAVEVAVEVRNEYRSGDSSLPFHDMFQSREKNYPK